MITFQNVYNLASYRVPNPDLFSVNDSSDQRSVVVVLAGENSAIGVFELGHALSRRTVPDHDSSVVTARG